jgi:hypothetical protein
MVRLVFKNLPKKTFSKKVDQKKPLEKRLTKKNNIFDFTFF